MSSSLSRRQVLYGIGAIGASLALPRVGSLGSLGTSTMDVGPPPEAYQPAATKNWWYFNGHLYDPGDFSSPLYDYMGALVMEHGGDTAGHYQLFTLVDNDGDGVAFAESTPGVIAPSTDNYEARFRSLEASGHVVRTRKRGPARWHVRLDPDVPATVDLRYASNYEPRMHETYQEGGGVANAIFWNQATLGGSLRTPIGQRPVVGVGFLEHVWGAWSRVPQKGVDYLNIHLDTYGGPATRRRSGRSADPPSAVPSGDLPTWGSVYMRRTFYHGAPDAGPVLDDVGPDLYLTVDGHTWYEAADLSVFVTEPHGEVVELREHRQGRPVALDLEAAFRDGGELSLHLDALPDVTIANPHDFESLGNVHEGAATVDGEVRLPDERRERRVSGIAQTEHQRYGPQYPY